VCVGGGGGVEIEDVSLKFAESPVFFRPVTAGQTDIIYGFYHARSYKLKTWMYS